MPEDELAVFEVEIPVDQRCERHYEKPFKRSRCQLFLSEIYAAQQSNIFQFRINGGNFHALCSFKLSDNMGILSLR